MHTNSAFVLTRKNNVICIGVHLMVVKVALRLTDAQHFFVLRRLYLSVWMAELGLQAITERLY
jgi:hypothetical protein